MYSECRCIFVCRRYQRQKLEDSYDSSEEDEWLDEHEDVDMDLPNIS